jgi:hypothetical protein
MCRQNGMNRCKLEAGKVIAAVFFFCKEGYYIEADEERCFSFKGIAKVACGNVVRFVFPRREVKYVHVNHCLRYLHFNIAGGRKFLPDVICTIFTLVCAAVKLKGVEK